MLAAIGANDTEALFEEIPAQFRVRGLDGVPPALSEMEVGRLMMDLAARDARRLNFVGAGAYDHHIPSAVWAIVSRGEFYSAYTPYQAEASQGTLQLLYEFQTMMARLTGMQVSNASLYDGGSALAEACLMAVRAHRRSKSQRILVPAASNPTYVDVARAIAGNQNLAFETLAYEPKSGQTVLANLEGHRGQDVTALVIQQPNFFGTLEDVDATTDWAHANHTLVIGVVNPTALAVLKPPGEWGTKGADIACGDGQPLGVPLSSGGPYFGFMATKAEHVRQMPGRIIGRTVDLEGKTGFALTLQAREQHIRRGKATSNICTNEALIALAANIYLSLMGKEGLRELGMQCLQKASYLRKRLDATASVTMPFRGPVYNEFVVRTPIPADEILLDLEHEKILGGIPLAQFFPEHPNDFLVAVTELHTREHLDHFTDALSAAIARERR
jgi:glycine dehydrogenase subunit 1